VSFFSQEFLWCICGALAGFIFNSRAQEYVGASDLFIRYNIRLNAFLLLFVDFLFFCGLGPTIVMGMYQPTEIYQAISLGLG
jgi:hypothetical protein